MTAYLGRHGRSEADRQGIYAGRKNRSGLVSEGEAQALRAAGYAQMLEVTRIVSSNSPRVMDTALYIREALRSRSGHILFTPDLEEYDLGILEGTKEPATKISSAELIHTTGVEYPWDFARRITRCLKQHDESEQNTLFIADGSVSRMVRAIDLGQHPDTFYDAEPLPTGGIEQIDVVHLSQKFNELHRAYGGHPLEEKAEL